MILMPACCVEHGMAREASLGLNNKQININFVIQGSSRWRSETANV
jgi:hypothetical protein